MYSQKETEKLFYYNFHISNIYREGFGSRGKRRKGKRRKVVRVKKKEGGKGGRGKRKRKDER